MDEEQPRGVITWFARAQAEGFDNLGAFELALGAAVLLSYLLYALLTRFTTLATLLFWILLVAALWYGNRLERRQHHALGKRHLRGTLFLGITCLTLGVALLLGLLLIGLAHARAWDRIPHWADGPLLLALVLGLYHLSQGLRLGVQRWLYLGGVLCGLAVIIPAVPFLRAYMYLVSALLMGGSLLISGYFGQREMRRRLLSSPLD
jgi:hypothetical protein